MLLSEHVVFFMREITLLWDLCYKLDWRFIIMRCNYSQRSNSRLPPGMSASNLLFVCLFHSCNSLCRKYIQEEGFWPFYGLKLAQPKLLNIVQLNESQTFKCWWRWKIASVIGIQCYSDYEELPVFIDSSTKSGSDTSVSVVKIFACVWTVSNVCISFGSEWKRDLRMDRHKVMCLYLTLKD